MLLGELDRLQGLVDDLLLLARGDERAFARDDVDLAARRRRGGGAPSPSAGRRSRSDDGGRSCVGDERALGRAVDHLVANAATAAATEVAVTVDGNGDARVAIHVDDDGPGIPPDQRADVVRRFVRLDEGRSRDGGGAGLGLAVAADVAAAHGGQLSIADSPLGGARVTIALPTARS